MRWPWDVEHYESGVPVESEWDRLLTMLQPFLAVAFAVLALATVHPLGTHGGGLARLLLILGSLALMLTVPIPDRVIDLDRRLVIATVAAVVTGALMGLVGQGWAGTFAYMIGVHAGVRFPPRTAIRVVALCVVVGVVLSIGVGEADTPAWTNLLVVAALVPGMTRRTRQLTLAAANEVVEQTRRAAESEAASRALAERAAIARDIHDVLAHSLSGVNMQLSLADALFDAGEDDRAREAVRIARHEVVTGLAEARAAVQTLRGDTIDPVEALQRLATGDGETVRIGGQPYALPGRASHTLVRTAQEALTNARRHAPGSPVTLALSFETELTRLDVRNGAGSTPSTEGSGLGLIGMRERAAQLDARVDAGPLPTTDPEFPGGWRVVLEIPRAGEVRQ